MIYGKYFNGTFFANIEAAWFYENSSYGGRAPTYIEQWRYMTEFGVASGPAKLGFLRALTPGLDRRNGTYIDRQPAAFLRQPTLSRELAGITLWRQHAHLMPYVYGSGLARVRRESGAGGSYYYSTFALDVKAWIDDPQSLFHGGFDNLGD